MGLLPVKAKAGWAMCPHALASWVPVPRKPTVFPDGTPRPAGLVGARLYRSGSPCVRRPGDHDVHRTTDGREWT